jgi:hypothetical protein
MNNNENPSFSKYILQSLQSFREKNYIVIRQTYLLLLDHPTHLYNALNL